MPRYKHRTPYGDVWFTLERRAAGGPWHYVFWHGGKRFRESTKTGNAEEARLIVERAIAQQMRPILPGAASVAKISAAVDLYLNSRWPCDASGPETRLKDRHYRDSRNRLHRFRDFVGTDEPFVTLTLEDARHTIQRFIDARRAKKKSTCTLHNDQKIISKLCSWMMQRRVAAWQANPADKKSLDIPRLHFTPKHPATFDDVDTLLVKAKDKPLFPFIVLMCSGLRPIGCTRVRWNDVLLTGKPSVRVPDEKGRGREIPLSGWAATKLADWKLRHPPTTDEERVYPSDVNNACMRLRYLRGENSVLTFGAMRRMAYVRLYQAGVSPQLAANIMGNSVRVALRHYVNVETMSAHSAIAALDYENPAQPPQKPPHDPLTDTQQQKSRKA